MQTSEHKNDDKKKATNVHILRWKIGEGWIFLKL